MYDYKMFKTALKGFDKDEVLVYVQQLKDEMNQAKSESEKAINERDKIIRDLKNRLVQKDEQRTQLENEIETKYKKYKDNFDKIGRLVFDAQLQSEQVISEAKAQADKSVEEAQSVAEKTLTEARSKAAFIEKEAEKAAEKIRQEASEDAASVKKSSDEEAAEKRAQAQNEAESMIRTAQESVDRIIADGRMKYARIQTVLEETLGLFSEIQKSFLDNYKEVHKIVEEAGTTMAALEGETEIPQAESFDTREVREQSDDDRDDIEDETLEDDIFEEDPIFREADEDFNLDDEDDEIPSAYRREEKDDSK